jgi:hypothetical protein
MARRNPYRPGTVSYGKLRRAELNRRRALAEANVARAKRPEAKRRAQRRASVARTEIKKIERREEIRQSLTDHALASFNRSTLRQQDFELLVHRVDREFPNAQYFSDGRIQHTGVPDDIPDPFASLGPLRGHGWQLLYSRQGSRRKSAAD